MLAYGTEELGTLFYIKPISVLEHASTLIDQQDANLVDATTIATFELNWFGLKI